MTGALTVVFGVWAAYAFPGAVMVRRLPLLKTGLLAISTIDTLRGVLLAPQAV